MPRYREPIPFESWLELREKDSINFLIIKDKDQKVVQDFNDKEEDET